MRRDTIRYLIILAAIPGDVVHPTVYAEYALLRLLECSITFLWSQLWYADSLWCVIHTFYVSRTARK